MASVEKAGKYRDKAIQRLEQITDCHAKHIIEMNRHLEDLDNRGRRNNLRVGGIPETITSKQIPQLFQKVFNNILERLACSNVDLFRAHGALRGWGPDSAPPRNIICCLQSFVLKEEMMAKARQNELITFNSDTPALYQHLSPITLKNRWALCPLLEILLEKGLTYRWRFPCFECHIQYNGKQVLLRTPDEL